MTKLKPCPFCGNSAHVAEICHGFKLTAYTVCCDSLGACIASDPMRYYQTEAEAAEAWNTRAATTIGQVAVEVVPTKRTCKLEPLEAFYVTVNMLDQTEWGVCSNCGTASPIDATYCCECGRKAER